MADVSHLERMGRELKCPICLGILNSAASLTCNHVFCNFCIIKSMKLGPNCPVCKVPYQPREIRHAPHMDNLVNVFKSMKSALGTDILDTQSAVSSKSLAKESIMDGNEISGGGMKGDSGNHIHKRKLRGKMPKKTSQSKLVRGPDAVKPSFPNKKRIQGPQNPLSESPLAAKKYESTGAFRDGSQKKPCLSKTGEPVLSPFFWLKENMDTEVLSRQTDDEELAMDILPVTFSDIEESPGQPIEDIDLEAGVESNQELDSDKGGRKFKKSSAKIGKSTKEKNSDRGRNQDCQASMDDAIVFDSLEEQIHGKSAPENPTNSKKRRTEGVGSGKSMEQLNNLKQSSVMDEAQCDPPTIRTKDTTVSHCDNRKEFSSSKYGKRSKSADKSRVCFSDISNVDHIINDKIKEKPVDMTRAKESEHGGGYALKGQWRLRNVPVMKKCRTIRQENRCAFCNSSENSEISGDMVHYLNGVLVRPDENESKKVISSHKYCAEWAPNVYFEGENMVNLAAELSRSRHIKCSQCGEKGAALGCFEKSCRRSFHFPCAKKITDCRWDTVNFVVLCPLHSSHNLPSESPPPRQKQRNKFSLKRGSSRSGSGSDDTIISSWSSGSILKPVLCCSALTPTEKERMMEFSKKWGCMVVKKWDSRVTHVVAATNEKGECRRTLKVMMGILHGNWILSLHWVEACSKAARLVEEEQFEISSDVHGIRNGPMTGRLRRLHKGGGVFEGKSFYLYGGASHKGYLQDLLKGGGGTVLRRKPVFDTDGGQTFVVYSGVEDEDEEEDRLARVLAESSGALPLTVPSLLHSIAASSSSLQPS